MSEVLKFLVIYTVFLGLFIWIEGAMGSTITYESSFSNSTTKYVVNSTTGLVTPQIELSWFQGLMSLSSKYALLNIIIFTPFIVCLVYVLICLFRGISP